MFDGAEEQTGFKELEDTLARLVDCGFLTPHPNQTIHSLAVIIYDEIYGRGVKFEERPGDHSVYLARLAAATPPKKG